MTTSVKNVEVTGKGMREQGVSTSIFFLLEKSTQIYLNFLKRERDVFINKTADKNVFPSLSRFFG